MMHDSTRNGTHFISSILSDSYPLFWVYYLEMVRQTGTHFLTHPYAPRTT
jgi:hypothetical protein